MIKMNKNQDLILNIVKKEKEFLSPIRPINTLQEIFSIQPVAREEKEALFHELVQILGEEESDKRKLEADFDQLALLSQACRAIQKQGIILVGEKIDQARSLFFGYEKSRALFSTWIKKTFSSEKSAYNALAFYQFYRQIEADADKEKFKKMPLKASYALASREGAIEEKILFIQNQYHKKNEEILNEIQSRFPLSDQDHRKKKKPLFTKLCQIEDDLDRLVQGHPFLSQEEKAIVERLQNRLTKWILKH